MSKKGSKLDIINKIKNCIVGEGDKFNKIFRKMFGYSGGWLTFSCIHGIIYAVKLLLRSESRRDYIDILRSLKYKPNVFINDMAHMVARHSKRQGHNIFNPFDGRVAENTAENVDQAVRESFQISLPWLNNKTPCAEELLTGDMHPVTGSNMHLALFDRLHEANTNSETEALSLCEGVIWAN